MSPLPPPRPPARVGIVGLGDQGTPIALRLLEQGWPLTFFARRAEVAERFTAAGATLAALPEMGLGCDIVLVVVGDAGDVRDAVVESGLLAAMRPGAILVVHSSIPPEAIRAVAAEAARSAVHCLDAPVSGGRTRSYAGDLTILVGGETAALEAARPVLAAYGSKIAHVGGIGNGQLVKALNNYFYAAHLGTAAKAIELVRALGVDTQVAADVLPACSGSSTAFAIQAARGFKPSQHDQGAGRAMDLLVEVVETLREAAADTDVDLGPTDRLVELGLAVGRAAGARK